jgi:hypothetical protein
VGQRHRPAARRLLSRPSTIGAHLRDLALDGTLWAHTATTLTRIGWSFTLAAVLGVVIGLAMGLWRRLREGLDPVFAVIYPIPSVLFLPLVSFLVPAGEIALVVTSRSSFRCRRSPWIRAFWTCAATTGRTGRATRGLRALQARVLTWQEDIGGVAAKRPRTEVSSARPKRSVRAISYVASASAGSARVPTSCA